MMKDNFLVALIGASLMIHFAESFPIYAEKYSRSGFQTKYANGLRKKSDLALVRRKGNNAVILQMTKTITNKKHKKPKNKISNKSVGKYSQKNVLTNGTRLVSTANNTQSTVLTLENQKYLYSANFCVGSEPCQDVELQIDTGSSDMWLPAPNSYTSASSTASNYGEYDISVSKTCENTTEDFNIRYGDGTLVTGYLVRDTVRLGSIELPNTTFAVATNNTAGRGVLGIGYVNDQNVAHKYENLPFLLKSNGIINKAAYSIYLDTENSASGQLVFGAIDEDKYNGALQALPILKKNDAGQEMSNYTGIFIELDGLSSGDNYQTNNSAGPFLALVDTGTTLLSVPSSIYDGLSSQFGTFNQQYGLYLAPCENKKKFNTTGANDGHFPLDFHFKDVTISVPYSNMLLNVTMTDGSYLKIDGIQQCQVAVQQNVDNTLILGDVFLRSAYTFIDLEENTVSLAQVQYNNSSRLVLL